MWVRIIAIASLLLGAAAQVPASAARSFAVALPGADGTVRPATSPRGYSAGQLRSAYRVTASGTGTIAIVGAYGDPQVAADLDVYSRQFGLPVLPACASAAATSCFERMDQRGGQKFSRPDNGWAMETALDTQAAHAMCPRCRIELVEADSPTTASLMVAVDRAAAFGPAVVSMSWGGDESGGEVALDAHFTRPGTIFVASSGDSGYGVSYPAASPGVVAVGGTHLDLARRSETAWSGSGSGCSRYEAKPAWQHDASCARRSVADVAADADPATGAAVYSSMSPSGPGWFEVGGTSLAAPLVAGLIADASPSSAHAAITRLYSGLGTARVSDVISGSTGRCGTYLCKAGPGYDGPTGVGSPSSPTAF